MSPLRQLLFSLSSSARFSSSLPPGLSKFFHNGIRLRQDAVSASISRVRHILRWFESQRQLTFYASSLLFVFEGLPSSSSSPSSFHAPVLNSPLISLPAGKTTLLSSPVTSTGANADTGVGEEGALRREGKGQEEEVEVAECNNNNIRVTTPWHCSLATAYTNHRKGGHHHYCAKGYLQGSHDATATAATSLSVNAKVPASNEEDNSAWKRTGKVRQQQPNGNGIPSQLETEDGRNEQDEGESEGGERDETKEQREGGNGEGEVEVRMIDFAHVFPGDSHDHGYIYGLKHLLSVLEQILHEAS